MRAVRSPGELVVVNHEAARVVRSAPPPASPPQQKQVSTEQERDARDRASVKLELVLDLPYTEATADDLAFTKQLKADVSQVLQ